MNFQISVEMQFTTQKLELHVIEKIKIEKKPQNNAELTVSVKDH